MIVIANQYPDRVTRDEKGIQTYDLTHARITNEISVKDANLDKARTVGVILYHNGQYNNRQIYLKVIPGKSAEVRKQVIDDINSKLRIIANVMTNLNPIADLTINGFPLQDPPAEDNSDDTSSPTNGNEPEDENDELPVDDDNNDNSDAE